MNTKKKEARAKFVKAIHARDEHAQGICRKIQDSAGLERSHAWDEKRRFGNETRYLLLAYAMIKGLPYKAVEKTTAEDNPAYPDYIRWHAEFTSGVVVSRHLVEQWLLGNAIEIDFNEAKPSQSVPVQTPSTVTAKPLSQPKVEQLGFFGFIRSGLKRLVGLGA